MNHMRVMASITLIAALGLSGCGGSRSSFPTSGMPMVPPGPVTAPQGQAAFAYGADALLGAQYLGPASVGALGVDVSLQLQNAAGLAAYASNVSDPKSPLYRHFLTPQQIGAAYGASQASLTSVAGYFASYGLHVGSWPQHLSLYVSGSQHALETAFGTTFGSYRQGTSTFIAPRTAPHFSHTLPVVSVSRLVSLQRQFRTMVPVGVGRSASGYSPQQIRNAFDFTGAYRAGFTGTGITVGVVGTGPISDADIPAYAAMFSTNVAAVHQVNVTDADVGKGAGTAHLSTFDQGFASPPPVTAPCGGVLPDCNPEDLEAQIDTESVASLAPASNVLFYLAYAPTSCVDANGILTTPPCASGSTPNPPSIGLPLADDEIQQAIADNAVDVLSLSAGGSEEGQSPLTGPGPSEFAALVAEGVAVFISSGDSGAEGCQRPVVAASIDRPCVSYPATDPSVVSVGGVNAPLDTFGNLTNQMTGWGFATANGGSGGGVSTVFPAPAYQAGIPGLLGTMRNQPDISLLGDPETGMAALTNAAFGAQVVQIGGTSVAAPEMAAMWALVLQACKQSATCISGGKNSDHPYRLGNPAPLLYALYAKGSAVQPTYAATFYDVVFGDNQQPVANPSATSPPFDPGFNAGVGYDQVTGLGVPFARALIKAVVNQ